MKIKNFFGKIFRGIKDHSADIKMGVGTGGVAVGTGLLCWGAVKSVDIVREYKEEKQKLVNQDADRKEIAKLTVKTVGKVALRCAPGAVVEIGGLGTMWNGYSDMKGAFIGVGVAYSGLQDFVDRYRQNVRDEYGEEADEKMASGYRTEEITIKTADGEKKERVRVYPNDPKSMPSPYARYFCYGEADGADRSLTYNVNFLKIQQDAANTAFRANRKFMLNDLYDMLGIKRSVAGNHVGWIYDKSAPEGDNHIDLRISLVYRDKIGIDGQPDGIEQVYMINPNVDGMVEEKMLRLGLMDP